MPPRRRSARRSASGGRAPITTEPKLAAPRRKAPNSPRSIPKPFLIAAGVFLVAVIALVVVNYWVSIKRPGDEPILTVNNKTFTWNDYVDTLKFQKLGTESLGGQFNAGEAPYRLMETLAENELVRQAAPREGLRVTKEQVRQEMISRLVPNAKDQSDQEQINREFEVQLHNYLAVVQLPRSAYETIVRTDLLRDQLRDKLGTALPRVQPHAFIHLLTVDNETSQKAEEDFKKGADFAAVARRYSQDEETRAEGGKVGYVPRLVYKDLDLQLFGLRENAISEPISTEKGYWVIKLIERDGEKARLQGILVDSRTTAREVEDKLTSGFTFPDLAAQLSIDAETKAKRGDMGLVAVGDRGGIFDELIRGAPLNKRIGPIGTLQGSQWLMVTERKEALEVTEKNFDVLKTRALEDWLAKERDANQINYCPGGPGNCFSNLKVDKALSQIKDVSLTRAQQDATATANAAKQQQQPPRFG